MARNLIVTALVAVLMAGFVLTYIALAGAQAPPSMGDAGGMAAGAPRFPPVKGFTEGQEIFFIHTEASDPQVADMLTKMMHSPVLVVPSLAQAPAAMLANVYVFTNGLTDEGPFGFQSDIFDNPPSTEGYSPLRAVHLVTWKDAASARVLKSAAEVQEAEARGEVTIERPGVVVNMPLLTWPGGQR